MDAIELWDELTEGEQLEVLNYMKRRTKYGSLDIRTMLIGAAVVIVGWAVVSLIRYIFV